MDKRTLLFVLLLTFALVGVNMFFDTQRQDSMREWNEQRKGHLAAQQQQVEKEIAEHTAKPADLPLINLYADPEATSFLTTGLQDGKNILTLTWDTQVPNIVYAKKSDETTAREVTLSFLPQGFGDPAVYKEKTETGPLLIGNLPDFGTYYLQLLRIPTQAQQTPKISLGSYIDGHLSVLTQQLEMIKREREPSSVSAPKEFVGGNAIVLIKSEETFLPVAIYHADSQKLVYLEEIKGLATLLAKPQGKPASLTNQKSEEQFYVLESPYQQLVFSNYGGALAEINLPFVSKSNQQSVVREIEFDREMVEKHPYNAHFPSRSYFTPGTGDAKSLMEHSEGSLGGYYPLLRRNLIVESGNRKSVQVAPRFYGFNIISEYPEVAELVYEVKEFDSKHIVFETNQNHRRITKTFSIEHTDDKNAPYILNLDLKIEGDSRGLWLTSGVPEVEWISGSPAPALKFRITRNQKPDVEQIDLPKDSLTVSSVAPDWLCNSNGFLGIIQDPLHSTDAGYRVQYIPGTLVPSRLVEIEAENERFKAQDMPGYMTLLPLKASGGTMHFRIFAGPFADSVLRTIDKTYSDPATGYNPDYIACQSFHGWFAFISEPFAKFLFILMKFFYQITGSWAFSIILLTIALRVMMYPLNAWSSKSTLRMQQIGPEVAAIQEKYKKEPKRAQVEIMNLYRERGVNPVSGCLPMLIQMPFLIGMFDLLKSTFELRGASFIPGWIDNLTSPDVLFSWTTPIFFIGNQFHLLPILLGLVMFLQQRLMSPLPADPSQLTDAQRQQKAMGSIMSVVFMLMFYNFPSGLNIYWLSSMLLGILQQWWTSKQASKKPVVLPQQKTAKKKSNI